MRVLFVAHSKQLGGAQNVLLRLVNGIRKYGVEPIVSVPGNGDGSFSDCLSVLNIQHVAHNTMVDCDMIVTNTMTTFYGQNMAKLLDVPHVWYCHELMANYEGLEKTGVIAISKYVQKALNDNGFNDTRVIYTGINTHENDLPYRKFATGERTYKILTVGGICERKNQMHLLKAYVEVVRAFPFSVVDSYGGPWEGAYFSALRKARRHAGLTNDQFCMHGFNSNMDPIYREADLFVATPIYEPFGLAILEAMSYGIPVIATKAGGPEEIITDGEDGLLVPVEELDPTVGCMLDVLANRKQALRMGEAARSTVAARFTERQFLKEWYDVICNVVRYHSGT